MREPYGFEIAEEVDAILLETVGATSDMPRGKVVDLIKEYLFRRCKTCAMCKKNHHRKKLCINHKKPKSKGGEDNIKNLQLLCNTCLTQKGDKTMLEARKTQRINKKKH
jgi:5-methylcytosine-specific restriction enzyme A